MNWFEELLNNRALETALPEAIWDTVVMVGISGIATVVIGGVIGITLHLTRPGGLAPMRVLYAILSSIIVNITRSIPYAILMVALIPFTQWLVGTSIGPYAATVSLTIATAPFFARLVETSLREVPSGTVDAAQVMGMSNGQIVSKVFLPEALPGLIAATTNTTVVLIGYSAMAGLIGGGDRKSTRLNSSHVAISYAVFCLKKKNKKTSKTKIIHPHRASTTRAPQ